MSKNKDANIPLGFCPHCKEEMLIQITTMVKENANLSVDIASCPKCDTVLNLDEDFKIRWVTEEEIKKLGWEKEKLG